MKKNLLLIILSVFYMNTIHAEITWTLSDDGTLIISGTSMPDYTGGASWYSQRDKIKKLIIEDGVTNIGNRAFSGCSNLTSIAIPNSVTSIGNTAFSGCSGLTSITIPNSVTSIGRSAFSSCKGLTTVIIPNSVTSIGDYAFNGCKGLTSITIPNSVTSIGVCAFLYCSSLTSITIPNSVTSIGLMAFDGCSGLTSITIPNSVTSIGGNAFRECSNLTSITIPNSVTSIGGNAFQNCFALTSITVEEGNTYYDSRDNCNAIIETKSNTLIRGCNNTVIPNSVTSIGNAAFSSCKGLISVTIPNSVTSIGDGAFYGCSGLTSVTIPNSVTSIGNFNTFNGCSALTSITVEEGNTYYDSRNNCNAIIETKSNTLISVCNKTVIPNSVTRIGEYAFYECSWLTSITIPNSVTSIGDDAFNRCKGLTSITIPNSVTSIGYAAFNECSCLTSVNIGNSVTSIGDLAFSGCSALTSITCEATTSPTCGFDCFYSVNKSIPVYVPANSVEAYQVADGWKEFTNIQAIDNQSIANAVIVKIDAIGKIEYSDVCKNKIDAANTAYDALTDEQKALVSNLDVLTTAQQTYDSLKAAAEKLAADKVAFDKYKSEIIAIIASLVKEGDSDAVKEIINKAISEIDALKYEDAISLDDNKTKALSFVNSVDDAVEKQRAEDQKTTSIEKLEFAEKVNIYDLNGRKITNSMLKSGLYIRNGKKVVVK